MAGMDHLIVEREDALLRITLNDPERRNPQTPSMWAALSEIGASLDPDIAVVLLQANGPSFSAGLDRRMLSAAGIEGEPSIIEIAAGGDASIDSFIQQAQTAFTWWRDCSAITVAAVQGHAIGAGAQLMLACDIAIIAEDLQFGLRETSLGLVPDLAGTAPLVSRVGFHRALDLCATGRLVGADDALAMGLAEHLVPVSGLTAAADALIAQLLAAPRAALLALKPLLRAAATNDAHAQLAAERAAQAPLLRSIATGGEVRT